MTVVNMRRSFLKGHGLIREGRPSFLSDLCSSGYCHYYLQRDYEVGPAWDGHARCSCGAVSPHLPTVAARKRWHREHKDALR